MLPLQKPTGDTADSTADSMDHMAHMAHNEGDGEAEPAWKHWALMALCCAPMILIAVLLIAGIWR